MSGKINLLLIKDINFIINSLKICLQWWLTLVSICILFIEYIYYD